MSEKILRALIQLFAIIAKQDGGLEEQEFEYVVNFLKVQMGEKGSEEYLSFFLRETGRIFVEDEQQKYSKPTSVLDSVRLLGICQKINKTLNQTQKVVVLLRLLELAASNIKPGPQRNATIDTVAEVLKIKKEDYQKIKSLVFDDDPVPNPNLLRVESRKEPGEDNLHIQNENLNGRIYVLWISFINIFLLKYRGNDELFLNGTAIHQDRIYLFPKGSTIKMPKGKPVYYSDIASRFIHEKNPEKISFHAENLSFRFPNGKKGLHDISLSAGHGNMVGILGASGAGKTTLLNVISGVADPYRGKVSINGIDVHKEKEKLPGITGYIPQDDLLVDELTVYENLYFNARLCLGHLNDSRIRKKVLEMLENVGLSEQKNLKVGSPMSQVISGGQRKRLNIALELIREPSILFVDEPTSGLSSRDSENVMDLLRELSLKGKLLFIVIHQPSSEIYKMFDRVVILDNGGYMVYFGNPLEAVSYFKKLDAQINAEKGECPCCGTVNPDLIFNILEARVVDEYGNYTRARKVSPRQWAQNFHEGREPVKAKEVTEKPPANLHVPSRLKQALLFMHRDLRAKLTNLQYIILTLLEAPLLAFILAYIIRYIADPDSKTYIFRENENIPIYIFMMLIVAVFLGLTMSAEEIFRDRKILKRERFLHLSRSGYLLAKISILFIISALQALAFVLVANSILEIKYMNFYYWLAFFTTAACANMIGLNISSGLNSAVTIYIVIPLLLIPMMVLSGAMFSFEKLNRNISRIDKVPLLAELMPTRWSFEALMVHQYRHNYFQETFYDYDKSIINSDFKLSYYLPELENRLAMLEDKQKTAGNINGHENDLLLLINELQQESLSTGAIDAPPEEMAHPGNFDLQLAREIKNSLTGLKDYYHNKFTTGYKAKNNKLEHHLRNQKKVYYSYLDNFFNESLSNRVRKIYEKNKVVAFNNHLVRLSDPVYQDPEPSNLLSFRTHFFAPRKHFFGKYFETYWFNIAVIWILIILLYLFLYFDVLKKILSNWKAGG